MGKLVELEQGSQSWIEWRLKGIGGSDSPIVEGISPYRTLRQLYFEKAGIPIVADDDSKDFIFERGHKTEEIIRKQFQDLMKVDMAPVCFEHKSYNYLRASLDGFDKNLGVLEAKLVGQEVLKKAKDGEIPQHHMSQMQHQFLVSGADVGQYFCHDGKRDGVLVVVKANQDYIEQMVEKEHAFWDMVKNGQVPPLSDRDYLEPEDTTLLKQLRELKELSENAAAQYESMKELVVNTYGGHPKIAGAGMKLFKVNRQGSISWATIPEIKKAMEEIKARLEADYIEKFRGKASESWTIRIG